MLYYVQSGDINVSLRAVSPLHAARKAVGNGGDCGVCVVVSEKKIDENNACENFYFLTENLIPANRMRIVT